MIMSRIRSAISEFRRNESGVVSIELLFMIPLLSLITFSMVVWFAAFKAQTHAIRATTVITDMVSRETTPITPEFINGVDGLMKEIIRTDDTPNFRVTAFTFSENNNEFQVAWSQSNGIMGTLDDAGLNSVANRLPNMRDGQRAILMQTSVDYEPLLDIGIGPQVFEGFSVAAPRFVPQICFISSENANPLTAQC